MAWYEMNAGGIPASLKSDMNSVLNKKFGTVSQDYPPEDWPADVNLMGPLPEKTASGAIASFSDGADTVPVKSCKVEFGPGGGGGTPADPVALVGYSGVNVSKAGKNLLENTMTSQTLNGTTFTVNADKSITVSGTPSVQTRVYIHQGLAFTVMVPSYFTSGTMPAGTRVFAQKVSGGTTSYPTISPNSSIGSIGDTLSNILLEINTNYDGTEFTLYPMIETGTAGTDYEPYTTPETISDSFGQTVYGGERDLVNEVISLKQTYNYYNAGDVTGLYWNGRKTSQVDTYHRATFRIASSGLLKASTIGKCNRLSYSSNITGGTGSVEGFQVVPTAGLYFCIPLDLIGLSEATSATDDSVFLTAIRAYADNLQFSLELATPVDITGLTAHDIETNYADNNFYADIPDSTMTVEYRADIPLALNA